ncbi:WhiB family transcriptional regulator [Streptomyces sp. NPDC006654]|uniref:WhiB family transcriptional regulator n=1 Tax=Streptomyces sp. NPDC006654 TaxID=3156897 RepID=UPI0033CC8056
MKNPYRPLLEQWAWQAEARCRGMDSSVFFSPPEERGSRRQSREEKAKEICAACPVREACALAALRAGETYGVWGGMTERERAVGRVRLGEPARIL